MPREGVPYPERLLCSLRCELKNIWNALSGKLHSVNGVEGDGQGNVDIVSGDAAVVVTPQPLSNQVEISLDQSQLPAADVNSVNGQTGVVILNADDIPSDGSSDVQADIDALKAADVTLQGNINAEATARGNADSALQTNINAANAAISLKVGGSGNIGSDTKPVKIVNGDAVAVTDALTTAQDVQDALDAYAPMVRTTGNAFITGTKQFHFNILGIATYGQGDTSTALSVGSYKATLRIARANLSTFRGVCNIAVWQRAAGDTLEFVNVAFHGNNAIGIFRFGFDTKTCEYFVSSDNDYVYIGIKALYSTLTASSKQMIVIGQVGFNQSVLFEGYNGTPAATPEGTLIAETS